MAQRVPGAGGIFPAADCFSRVKAQGKCLGRPPGSKDKRKRKKRQRLVAL